MAKLQNKAQLIIPMRYMAVAIVLFKTYGPKLIQLNRKCNFWRACRQRKN